MLYTGQNFASYAAAYSPYSAESTLTNVQGNIQEVENNRNMNLVYAGGTAAIIIIIYVSLMSIMSPLLIVAFTALLGALALLSGFRYFSRHMLTANTPVSKIFSAPTGFGIFNVQFVPENGQPLISPVTRTPCVLYSVTINMTIGRYYNYGSNNTPTNIISYFNRGTHSILTDGTGYIVTQLGNFGRVEGLYKIYYFDLGLFDEIRNSFSIPKEILPLTEAIDNANSSSTDVDLTNIISSLKTKTTEQKVGLPPRNLDRNGYSLIEYVIPANKDYTAIGFLDHTEKTLNNKPVSKLVRDPQTKMLDLRYGTEKSITHKYDRKAYTMFAIGMIALVIAYLGGSYHNFYECLIITNNSNVYSCHYINGTTVVLYGQQQESTLNAHPITIYITVTTIPSTPMQNTTMPHTTISTIIISNITIPLSTSANYSSCKNFTINIPFPYYLNSSSSLAGANLGITRKGICVWKGGYMNITFGGGYSGWAALSIKASNGSVVYSKSGDIYCPQNMGPVYVPAGTYTLALSTGNGGGACGPAVAKLT